VRRYGWRAYALPVLALITVVALATAANGGDKPAPAAAHRPSGAAPPTAAGNISLKSDPTGADAQQTALATEALPPGAPYTVSGAGTFHVLSGSGPVVGTGTVRRYSIDVENGITGINLGAFAKLVQQALSDKRSWAGHGVALQWVSSGPVDFHVTLTSSMTVRKLCGYTIPIETSCFARAGSTSSADTNRVVLNDARWVRGDAAYVGDLEAYQIYMVNHESGHALGHLHAHACLPGGLAPVMMQQTIGLKSATTGTMCQANPWPYPPGVPGAPGAEGPDTPQNSEVTLGHD
jgi:Protein of unknown function (DUF3152)